MDGKIHQFRALFAKPNLVTRHPLMHHFPDHNNNQRDDDRKQWVLFSAEWKIEKGSMSYKSSFTI